MRCSILVAMSENRVIGRNGRLPWRLSADLRRFKQLTLGHHLVMGRKTFESIGRLLPGRTTIVVTRQPDDSWRTRLACEGKGILVARTLEEAQRLAAGDSEVFIVGGGEIYRQSLAVADRIYMTLVHAEVAGDTFFPELDEREWQLAEQTRHGADEKNEFDYTFLIYERVKHD
jgi:dihydrofolate reductase